MSRFFGKCEHAAFVVPDFDTAVDRLIDSGIGPVFVMKRIRVAGRFWGKRHDALFSAAFAYSGSTQYEFICQHDDTPSAYREFIERNPAGGLHHTAYFTPEGFDAALAAAKAAGTEFEIVQEFIGPDDVAYEIYVEPKDKRNPLLATDDRRTDGAVLCRNGTDCRRLGWHRSGARRADDDPARNGSAAGILSDGLAQHRL